MLNRYGLIDVDALREAAEAAEEEPAGEGPPPPEGDDPTETLDKAKSDNQSSDLDQFRSEHKDVIYRISRSRDSNDYGRNTELQMLRSKFNKSGVDKPFFVVFDPATSGLKGRSHLSLIASLHHGGTVSGSTVRFLSAGDATEFAAKAPEIRDDLSFEVGQTDPTTVGFKQAEQPQAAPEEASPAEG